jgi:ABC-type branched-subunit amino acid transport system substrate-binding protein
MRIGAALSAASMMLAACGAPPARSWIERDIDEELGSRHVADGEAGSDTATESGSESETESGSESETESGSGSESGTAVARALQELDASLAALRRAPSAAARQRVTRSLAGVPASSSRAIEPRAGRAAASASEGAGAAQASALLSLHLARLALHANAAERAAPYLAQAAAALALAADGAAAAELARQLGELQAAASSTPSSAGSATRVAVLLPLSGRFAGVGAELRRAIELAPAAGVQWQFLDTRGEPAQAQAMVEQAASGGAVAILGPVGDREAVGAARRASQRGVPIALLAPGDGGDVGLGVFRLTWSAEDEARAVAAWAAANDYQNVAVLAPRDDVGELAAGAFVIAARQLGLTVAAQGQYDAAGGSVEADLKRFLGLVPAQNPRLAAHLRRGGKRAWQTFVPEVAFSLLYVPDRADRAALVAAFLPYLGLELRTEEIMDPVRLRRKYRGVIPQVVQLVGGAGWNTKALPARGGNAVQGALIFDVCTAQRDDIAAELAGQLEARLGHAPSSAAAQAYDAATGMAAAVTAARAAGRGHRAGVRAALAQLRLEEGACGGLAIGGDGEVQRETAVLQVDGEDLVLAP